MSKKEKTNQKVEIEIPPAHVRLFKREGIELMTEEDFNYLLKFTNDVLKVELPKVRHRKVAGNPKQNKKSIG
uniref:Uncharacterized protein n=1 Tax=Ditylenchus dipsaci TaxID=166011 RepID=A0A915DS40_9BILA